MQYARSGDGYTGIIVYKKEFPYNEYIQGQLKKPLEKGTMYKVTFYVSCSEFSKYSSGDIGVYLSRFDNTSETMKLKSNQKSCIVKNLKPEYFSDKNRWKKFTGIYKSSGLEKYINIGNVTRCNKERCAIENEEGNIKIAYYYIDDVCVEELQSSGVNNAIDEKPVISKNEIKFGKTLIIAETDNIFIKNTKRIFRETRTDNKFKKKIKKIFRIYDDESKNKKKFSTNQELILLKYFAEFVKMHPNIIVEINIHTADQPTKRANLKLSWKRARAIYRYLIRKGVYRHNMIYSGVGSKYKKAKTKEGEALNDKIEFKIIRIW